MKSIALVMIARDEARCIERCLRSAHGVVDQLLVLDTGSADATPELAAACGAQVLHSRWTDDFAAARNTALAANHCDWALVLDADEWIAGGAESLQACRDGAPGYLGLVRVASLVSGAPGQQSVNWLPRLLPRDVRYAGRVHEQPVSGLPRRRLALQIGHDGYLPEALARKSGRNRQLLERSLREQPSAEDDGYLRYQLGKDHEVQGGYAAAAPLYLDALQRTGATAAWRHDLVLRCLFTLKKLARFDEALQLAESEMPHWGHSPDFFFCLGDLLLDRAVAAPAQAAALLPMIESSWRRALQIGDDPSLPDTVPGRGSFLAAHNLAAMFEAFGDRAQAQHWRERAAQLGPPPAVPRTAAHAGC